MRLKAAGQGRVQRVLIVDDEPHVRLFLAKVCKLLGIEETAFAEDGEEAIAQVGAFEPGLVLMDINMPGMDGPEALGQLNAFYRKVPVVFVTSDARPERVREAIRHGAMGFLRKDLPTVVLKEKLNELLERAAKEGAYVEDFDYAAAAQAAADAQREARD
ncbi:MAG: response regulator transcription factor [Opitutales bacterium]